MRREFAESKSLKERYESVHEAILDSAYSGLQGMIDNGSAWLMEGALGRAAMRALEAGACVLPPKPGLDYYGTMIPSYEFVKDAVGSPGSVANAEAYEGDDA
jgi:hypothetical protein